MDIQSLNSYKPTVTAVSGTTPTTMTSPPPTPALNGTLAGISQQLGMSTRAVQGALKQGTSITELAQQHGVSRDTLVQSVESQIQENRQASGQPPLDQTVLDRIVSRAFDHHHHGHRVDSAGSTGPGVAADAISAASSPDSNTGAGTAFALYTRAGVTAVRSVGSSDPNTPGGFSTLA